MMAYRKLPPDIALHPSLDPCLPALLLQSAIVKYR